MESQFVKILIAEDDAFFRKFLHQLLGSEYEVATVADGTAAWNWLQGADGPVLAILDWVMPGMAGPQICRTVRAQPRITATYLILLTARHSAADILAGLRSGADDYVTKPFVPEELRARVRLGQRILELEQSLVAQAGELERAQAHEATLQDRLAALESSVQEAIAQGTLANAYYPNTKSTFTTETEASPRSGPPLHSVNNSKVS